MAPQPTDTHKDPKTDLIVALYNQRGASVPAHDAVVAALNKLAEREIHSCMAAGPDMVLLAQGRARMIVEIRDLVANCHNKYKELFG